MINSVRSKILNIVPTKTIVESVAEFTLTSTHTHTPFEYSDIWTQLYWIQVKLTSKLPTPQQAGVGESAGLIIKLMLA
jgi:hypothetical protein